MRITPPTLCFATICKNEEHVILQTLEAAAPFVTHWVICDTGSTDRTCEIVATFFAERGITTGRLYRHEWDGFDVNKTRMMECAKRTEADYVLHLDADDWLVPTVPEWGLSHVDPPGADCYVATLRRGTDEWKATVIYNNRLTWRFCGVAHTIIKCEKEQPLHGTLRDCYIDAEARGSRAFDPNKYLHDAKKLEAQYHATFVKDPDGLHARSAFYCAQSYMDSRRYAEAIHWYQVYSDLGSGTWIEELFEAKTRIARCLMAQKKSPSDVEVVVKEAIAIEPDRAEPAYWFGMYCNQQGDHERAYKYLRYAKVQSLEIVRSKYALFVNPHCYGKYINDELSVACFWTDRCVEGLLQAKEIVDDPAFAEGRARIVHNIDLLRGRQETLGKAVVAATAVASQTDPFALRSTTPNVIVVDDFYANPEAVRALALRTPFQPSPAYHKGERTTITHRPEAVRQTFERLIGKEITRWDDGTNGVFQFCTAQDALVYHYDHQQYAAVVHLTPNAPPEAGTSFYRQRGSGRRRSPIDFTGGFYDRTQFDLVDAIGNVFNRCVIWDAQLLHAASVYFGQTKEDGRLFHMFFFDC